MVYITGINNPQAVKESQPRQTTQGVVNSGANFLNAFAEAAKNGQIVIYNETLAEQASIRKERYEWNARAPKKEESVLDFLNRVERLLAESQNAK